ncbi:thermonuclease family protein [Rhizobium sp. VS19-DR104.2]|uniref:thermonuclease family protein n=1 Tax=unclassified Rhizobium TaxID=2613769 RepID=UPI001C5AF2D7|nr:MULTISPECIES: thermonuclease family protein [unclassified Rhizobium]MBZ5763374.1 thermonuclease family protein [Rhizobium sp. VS19-DR96]MBZ5769256.1 thermonuclease family protein [Rhizobium sp. VS19-DR129.2]MBZ5776802.1 thermonuclease family protein [Rhizobium sp. VS19-DRK62.2]MBZ5787893.1 thermonuclease family protein [Rhizobium sp. VS19-DR121]MBZ5805394.1 thermonuclease family protein [Rhizobium sp. VS19-DR181]
MTGTRPGAKILLVALSISMAIPRSMVTAEAAQPSSHVFAVPQTGVTFLTGDSWQQAGQTMRLYGVQACIRGTTYTDKSGQKQDCGAVSLAMLAAIFQDTKPTCAPLAEVATPTSSQHSTILVICSTHVGSNALDVGTMLITQGFAFAALTTSGKAVYMPYGIEEGIAQQSRAGLWAYPDIPYPNHVLFSNPARRE